MRIIDSKKKYFMMAATLSLLMVMSVLTSCTDNSGIFVEEPMLQGKISSYNEFDGAMLDITKADMEKADRHVEGAFAIINQQFAEHLPEQYIYLNREEDMGIPGLRQAKLSYHPEILLTYNVVHITKND